jgi:hypothetical protein
MKRLKLFTILFVLTSCNNVTYESKPKIIVNARVIIPNDKSFQPLIKDPNTLKDTSYHIKLSILNKSDIPVSFWMMSCSWEEDFLINNDYFEFIDRPCDNNVPIIKHVRTNDSIILQTTIVRINGTRYQNVLSTKFGFIYIDSLDCKDRSSFMTIIGDKSKHVKIFWSNELTLKK